MKMNVDLGSKDMGLCCPAETSKDGAVYYPSFHYSGKKELDLPKEGTMVVKFRKTSSSESEDRKGKESYSCTIEIQKIISAEGAGDTEAPASNKGKDTEDALDSIMRALKDEKSEKE